jgi:plasmid rolling circle replication initiator protein Rep
LTVNEKPLIPGVTTRPVIRGFFYAYPEKHREANLLKTSLTALSPSDKPWDVHKSESTKVARIYASSWAHIKKAERMLLCSGVLEFGEIADEETGEVRFRLLKARFCRVRYCPICQWRRSLLWRAKFYQALPGIITANPTARFIFLTLTVENCRIEALRETLQGMGKAWGRFIKRKEFSSVMGWVRTTEVTREKDDPKRGFKARLGYCHPHFHCLLMVPSSYFKGGAYVNQKEWGRAWQGSLRVEYEPRVDVRAVRRKTGTDSEKTVPHDGLVETLKYSVKPSDMTEAPEWFLALTEQTHRLRFIATGGLFKDVLKPEEKITEEEMIHLGDDTPRAELVRMIMRFLWEDKAAGYFLQQTRLPGLEDTPPRRLSKPKG